jgi:hypothetical protein
MTATNHGLFGSFIAITLQAHPVLAVCIAPFSHFLLDALPHFGDDSVSLDSKKFFKRLGLDAFLAVVTTLVLAWIWSDIALLVIACAFLAASPDLMWIYYQYINKPLMKKHLVPRFHSWIQWSQTPNGFYIEVVWFFIFFAGIAYFGV